MTEVLFEPNPTQQRSKATFWIKYRELPGIKSTDTINAAIAMQVTGDARISNWWAIEGFKEWFCNDKEWQIELEMLCYQLPGVLASILAHDDPKALSAQVNAIKLIIETTGRAAPKVREIKMLDKAIGNMDKEQLKEYIKQNSRMLGTPSKED